MYSTVCVIAAVTRLYYLLLVYITIRYETLPVVHYCTLRDTVVVYVYCAVLAGVNHLPPIRDRRYIHM